MPLVEINAYEVIDKLALGPVGIGEKHTKPRAREFVKQLILMRYVNVLFLEIPTGATNPVFDECLTKAMQNYASVSLPCERMPFEQQLRAVQEEHRRAVQQASLALNHIDAYMNQNQIRLSELIIFAMAHDVCVVFADLWMKPHVAHKPNKIRERNRNVEKIFVREMSKLTQEGEVTNTHLYNPARAARSVILFGAEHFKSDEDQSLRPFIGEKLDQTLHWVDLSN